MHCLLSHLRGPLLYVAGFSLRADPERMTFETVADAIDRDPTLDRLDVQMPTDPGRLN